MCGVLLGLCNSVTLFRPHIREKAGGLALPLCACISYCVSVPCTRKLSQDPQLKWVMSRVQLRPTQEIHPQCTGMCHIANPLPRKVAPVPRFLTCVHSGDSYFGLGWGWASLVYWHHLGGMCCEVMHVTRPVLMHVQRPGRRVAGCCLCRRVQLRNRCVVAVVWCCWPSLGG